MLARAADGRADVGIEQAGVIGAVVVGVDQVLVRVKKRGHGVEVGPGRHINNDNITDGNGSEVINIHVGRTGENAFDSRLGFLEAHRSRGSERAGGGVAGFIGLDDQVSVIPIAPASGVSGGIIRGHGDGCRRCVADRRTADAGRQRACEARGNPSPSSAWRQPGNHFCPPTRRMQRSGAGPHHRPSEGRRLFGFESIRSGVSAKKKPLSPPERETVVTTPIRRL